MQVDHDEARKIAEADDPWIYTDPVGKLAAAYLDLRKKAEEVMACDYNYDDFDGTDSEWDACIEDASKKMNALRSCLKGSTHAS